MIHSMKKIFIKVHEHENPFDHRPRLRWEKFYWNTFVHFGLIKYEVVTLGWMKNSPRASNEFFLKDARSKLYMISNAGECKQIMLCYDQCIGLANLQKRRL